MVKGKHCFGILSVLFFTAALVWFWGCAGEVKEERIELCQGYYQNEEQAKEQLERFAASYSTLREWKRRRKNIIKGMLAGAELNELPKRCALKPIIHSKRIYDGYSVENAAFESLPGFWVTGNLYRPVGMKGKFAGILCPHGHGKRGRFREANQSRCAMFARMGAIVFSYDMIGYGESTQTEHNHPKAVAIQTWNSMRAIDFLLTFKEVDPKRIAVTGASGGGTQSFLLTALDKRVAVSVPAVQISAHFFGGCICESGMPIHKSSRHETSNVEISALAAPRPQLIISDGDDWTKNVPEVEYPYIKKVYGLYGAADLVENLHLADEGHDYGPSKRAGAYKFLVKHLGLSTEKVLNEEGKIVEAGIVIEEDEKMKVFNDEHPRPDYALKQEEIWP
jgi:dienelactone hydrolase